MVHSIFIFEATLGPQERDLGLTLHPVHRTHLYGAVYETPRPIPGAKGKVAPVGGEFLQQVFIQQHPGCRAHPLT